MNTVQNYPLQRSVASSFEPMAQPFADSCPRLTVAIRQLQDVQLLADHPVLQAPHNAHLRWSIESLAGQLTGLIAGLHPEILECIQYQPAQA